jgi:hypothetical protein
MTLYIKTTDDEYELPVAVGESVADLARQLHVSSSVISHGINNTIKGIYHHSIYKKVEVEDDD